MKSFTKEYNGITFCGSIVSGGPYPDRLSVAPEVEEDTTADEVSWPGDDWISEATGESVRHWTSGEGDFEEVYLPVIEDENAAENARIMYS